MVKRHKKLSEFCDLPGFFRVERGSRATGPMTSVTVWMVGADPLDDDGQPSGRCLWGEGASLEGAIDNWWSRHDDGSVRKRAGRYWTKRSIKFQRKAPRR